jgi:hypothetical protein
MDRLCGDAILSMPPSGARYFIPRDVAIGGVLLERNGSASGLIVIAVVIG